RSLGRFVLEGIRQPSGWIPKRPKGPDCKSGGTAFAGSNPAPPILETAGGQRDRGMHPPSTADGRPERVCDLEHRVGTGEEGPCGGCNSMVEYLPSKQATWVRFPSPALKR